MTILGSPRPMPLRAGLESLSAPRLVVVPRAVVFVGDAPALVVRMGPGLSHALTLRSGTALVVIHAHAFAGAVDFDLRDECHCCSSYFALRRASSRRSYSSASSFRFSLALRAASARRFAASFSLGVMGRHPATPRIASQRS